MADDEPRELAGGQVAQPALESEPPTDAPENETDDVAIMPSFQFGGRVVRTGLALVHDGEFIMPAPGSEAVVSPAGTGPAGQPVTWSFPVHVEVVGQLSEEHVQAVARHVFDELDIALRGMG
jgi:hypothetical protein